MYFPSMLFFLRERETDFENNKFTLFSFFTSKSIADERESKKNDSNVKLIEIAWDRFAHEQNIFVTNL